MLTIRPFVEGDTQEIIRLILHFKTTAPGPRSPWPTSPTCFPSPRHTSGRAAISGSPGMGRSWPAPSA